MSVLCSVKSDVKTTPALRDQAVGQSVSTPISLLPMTTHLLDILIHDQVRCTNYALHEMKIIVPSGAGPIVVTQ